MSERQKKFYDSQKEKGMVRVNVWVHESRKQELLDQVEDMKAPSFIGDTPTATGSDYKVLYGSVDEIENTVKHHMRLGWRLHGAMMKEGANWVQVVVKD